MTTATIFQQKLHSFFTRNCKDNFASFEDFLNDVGNPPRRNMKLTRKCIKKGYTPGNLVWAKTQNRSSGYLVKTSSGNVASLRSACEQDGVTYQSVHNYMNHYPIRSNPQAVFELVKMDKNSRRMFKRNAFVHAINNLA